MARYERSVRVQAPLDAVWTFHSRISGLEALTPGWLQLRVESVVGPDGEHDPDTLDVGTDIRLSMAPFGIGPRQQWTSRITDRERRSGAARFRDEMVEGPVPEWVHTHLFFQDGDETLVRDRVRYRLPAGELSGPLNRLAVVGFEPLFRYRHRQTKERLESDAADPEAER